MSSRAEVEHLTKLLKEANQRAEEEQQRAEEAGQRAEEERQRAEEAGQRAEEAVLRAEGAERLREKERQRAEEAGQRAKEAGQRAEEAGQRAEEAAFRTRKTTFEEYLKTCHERLHKPLLIELDKRLTTKGFTSAKNKFYPKTLSPWEGFPEINQQHFDEICGFIYPGDESSPRLFSPILHLEELSRKIRSRRLASESDLESYERMAVEDMVTDVISQLCDVELARDRFELGQGVTFENHMNNLHDAAEEVQERLDIQTPRARPSKSSDSDSGANPTRTRANQFCVYKNMDGIKNLLFVVEYKPPHKLSIGNLKAGFREMKIEDILGQATIPTEPEAKLQYNADQLVSAVATQTFHYMIENGLKYRYITTGEVFVFLHIKKKDPTTLYYHLTVPTDDATCDAEDFLCSQTAISQVATMCLLAFRSKQRDQRWRQNAKKHLKEYIIDYEEILLRIPETERKLTPSIAHKGRWNLINKRSPYLTRSRATCNPDDIDENNDDEQDDPDTPSGPRSATVGYKKKDTDKRSDINREDTSKPNSDGRGQRRYCTQACLLGIARKSSLDQKCPNAPLHCTRGKQHAIDLEEFVRLVREQLAEDLDHDCEPLGLQGARGALFKIALTSHGYVFVGKGTVRAFVPDLLHEGRVYQQLKDLQGTAVPVYLGNVDLVDCYYLDVGVRILHMLLMSWGGETIAETVSQNEVQRTVREVRRAGIDQQDFRTENILWNEKKKRAMLIDFERAVYIERCAFEANALANGKVLREISPNTKRKRVESLTSRQAVATRSTIWPKQRSR